MGLERVHTNLEDEEFGPVRLGPQDLRDIAQIFDELASKSPALFEGGAQTAFTIGDHRTTDIEDVLAYADADTIPSLHVMTTGSRTTLWLFIARSGTSIGRSNPPSSKEERDAAETATEKLRRLVRARELSGISRFRQEGPGKWAMIALLVGPALVSFAVVAALQTWLSAAAANAAAWGVPFLCYVPLLALLSAKPRDVIRLRGRDEPWWERRAGLVALTGVALSALVPFVIYALEILRR